MKIPSNDLYRQFAMFAEEYERKAVEVLRSGWYILGNEVRAFESEFAQYVGTKHCVALANGLDALTLSIRALGIGPKDEVLVQANTYIASVMGITLNGATPVFVEPNEFHNIDVEKLESHITANTKGIMVVHLYGQACNMEPIRQLCKKRNLYLIEDCAQAHGAQSGGVMVGSQSNAGCFSFYPSKNLGGFGDGGAVTTDDDELAEKLRMYRNYGSEKRYYNKVVGVNSRLDEIQAGLLRVKLPHADMLQQERTHLAERYLKEVHNPSIELPRVDRGCLSVWHLFVVQCKKREKLIAYLEEKNIQTIIHYPIPPHLSEAYGYMGYKTGDFPLTERLADTVLTLPLFNGMTKEEQDYVIDALNRFDAED